MKKIVVYFHGYGSSANTDKVQQLRDAGIETYSWDIDINPIVSLPELGDKIDDMLMDKPHEPARIFFLGTSLGAWYASVLGSMYGIKTVLINPSYNPKESLIKYGVDEMILMSYFTDIQFNATQKVFIGTNDEVIDFTDVDFNGADVTYIEGGDHRFNKEFHHVIDYIKEFK
jgi:predicted esterase YcpF (UPF0227 family)